MKSIHIGKKRTASSAISHVIGYVSNSEKTNNGQLVTSYGCDARLAGTEFMLAKREYEYITGRDQGKRNVLAYHIRQSFMPGEITPERANEIGRELAMRFTKGKHAFVVSTHIDKAHVHNHVIFNSTTLDCTKKFKDFKRSARVVRRLSDQICVENGLSIIENPKPSRGHYGAWAEEKKKPSYQEILRRAVDEALRKQPADFDAFLKNMEAMGIEVIRQGKHLKFRAPGQTRVTRCNTLKGNYTEDTIRERIAEARAAAQRPTVATPPPVEKVGLLIDIQLRLQQGKGPGFERWAKIHNLKEAAKTLVTLQENGLDDYALLEEKATGATDAFRERTEKLKATEKRLEEISTLQKHIGSYTKTLDTYRQYHKSGYSKKFRATHEADILLHQAAKRHFDSLGLKKLPTIKTLQREYAALLAEKKKLYQGYHEERENMRQLQMLKANVDSILRITPDKTTRDDLDR